MRVAREDFSVLEARRRFANKNRRLRYNDLVSSGWISNCKDCHAYKSSWLPRALTDEL